MTSTQGLRPQKPICFCGFSAGSLVPLGLPAAGKKAKTLIAGLKVSDADRRKDWVQRTTRSLAHALDVIRAENLNVVTRSAQGTVDSPGRSGAQKAGLNRGMLASRPGLLLTRLEQTSTRQARNSQLRTRRRPVNAGTHTSGSGEPKAHDVRF